MPTGAPVQAAEARRRMVMASPGEDAEGRHPVWWLEGDVPGHWSSGSSVAVFQGDMVNVVVTASNCNAALGSPTSAALRAPAPPSIPALDRTTRVSPCCNT